MHSVLSLPKEVKYTQYLVYTSVVLSSIGLVISSINILAVLNRTLPLMLNIVLLIIVYVICLLFIGLLQIFPNRHLGQLRQWARFALIVEAVIGLNGIATFIPPFQSFSLANTLSPMYNTALNVILYIFGACNIIMNILILYLLLRQNVREAFQQDSHPIPNASPGWLRALLITLSILGMLATLLTLTTPSKPHIDLLTQEHKYITFAIDIIIYGCALYVLFRPDVRKAFRPD